MKTERKSVRVGSICPNSSVFQLTAFLHSEGSCQNLSTGSHVLHAEKYLILSRKERRKEKKKRQDGLDSCSFRSQRKYPLLFHFFIKSCRVNLVCCLITHFEMEFVPSCRVPLHRSRGLAGGRARQAAVLVSGLLMQIKRSD